MTHKNSKMSRIFMFFSTECSLLRAEGFSCSLGVLYGGLGISKLQFLIKKMEIKFPAIIFFYFRSSNPRSGSAIRKNAGSGSVSGSALNQCGSETLPSIHFFFTLSPFFILPSSFSSPLSPPRALFLLCHLVFLFCLQSLSSLYNSLQFGDIYIHVEVCWHNATLFYINYFLHSFIPVLRLRVVYPGSRILIFLPIPDPGSRILNPKTSIKRGEKIFLSYLFCSHNFHNIEIFFLMLKKKIWPSFQ